MVALLRALEMRLRAPGAGAPRVVMPLRGGSGALLSRRVARHMVSTATPDDAVAPSRGIVGWLERIQATRSSLLVVPDRPTGVTIALRWGLSPEKLRLEGELGGGGEETAAPGEAARPWYAR